MISPDGIIYEGSFECGKPKNIKAKVNNLEYYIGNSKTALNYNQDFNFVKFIKHCNSDTANDVLEIKNRGWRKLNETF